MPKDPLKNSMLTQKSKKKSPLGLLIDRRADPFLDIIPLNIQRRNPSLLEIELLLLDSIRPASLDTTENKYFTRLRRNLLFREEIQAQLEVIRKASNQR